MSEKTETTWSEFFGVDVSTPEFLPFEEAREFARGLNLKNRNEWIHYCKSDNKRKDIPSAPEQRYVEKWVSWGDFLGSENVATKNMEFTPFIPARKFVRSLELKSKRHWQEYLKNNKIPYKIPSTPDKVYKEEGWCGWGDFLGTGYSKKKNILAFEEARHKISTYNLKSIREFKLLEKELSNIPSNPDQTYKNKGWVSWGDFLGTGNIANFNKEYFEFEKARRIIQKLNLKSKKEWDNYCKSGDKHEKIPSDLYRVYGKHTDWCGMGDFLGNGNIAPFNKNYYSFSDAKKFARSLNFESGQEWVCYWRKNMPDHLPCNPHQTYKNSGWRGWPDFLGNKKRSHKKNCWSFVKARELARQLNLKTRQEYKEYCKKESSVEIPCVPNSMYKDEWVSWGDWLGTGNVATFNRKYLSFELAREFVQKLNLNSYNEWQKYYKTNMPCNIPSDLYKHYKDHEKWMGIGDFLGSCNSASRRKLTLQEAKQFIKKTKIQNHTDWKIYCKNGNRPNFLPANLSEYYQNKGWISWDDFFGKTKKQRNRGKKQY